MTDLRHHVHFADWTFTDRDHPCDPDIRSPLVWFASFQDLLGTTAEGQVKARNEDIHLIHRDCIVLDEFHFGAWQGAARELCSPASATTSVRAELTEAEVAADRSDEAADAASAGDPRLIAATPDAQHHRGPHG